MTRSIVLVELGVEAVVVSSVEMAVVAVVAVVVLVPVVVVWSGIAVIVVGTKL